MTAADTHAAVYDKLVGAVVSDLGARSVLAYGAHDYRPMSGISKQVRFAHHDPTERPFLLSVDDEFDLVVSHEGVEQLPEHQLGQALGTLHGLGHVFFIIFTRFSGRVLRTGEDSHRIVRSASWWLDRIRTRFPEARELPWPGQGVCLITTWQPSTELAQAVEEVGRQSVVTARWARRRSRLKGRLWRLLRPPIAERQIHRELAGKRVALVGNARSLADRDYGAVIDSADIVVRCNRGVIVNTRSHGSRTDWLCTSVAVAEDEAAERRIKRFIWTSRRPGMMRSLPSWLYASGRLSLYSMTRYRALQNELGSLPSTGMKAIDLIAASKCERLDIFGFDFGHSNSASEPTGQMSPEHDFSREQVYVLKLAANDPRLRLHQ